MIRFDNDYSEGAHPAILQKLMETNLEQTPGYGCDPHCQEAARLIRSLCGREDVAVHLLVGGTQTNLTLLSAALRPHQGALCAESGHINVHEAGAIEATGHKVLPLPSGDGKITALQVRQAVEAHRSDASFEHMVQPKLVYISHPTEIGTLYTLSELTALSQTCRELGLYLYLDGARLGYGLAAQGSDLDLPAIARLCDAFYIGGTKVGALFGEALVISHPALQEDFRYLIKQKGGLLAKGRLLGIQFVTLLQENRYLTIAAHANRLAGRIAQACREKGFSFLTPSVTNQQFPILPDALLEELSREFAFTYWQRVDPLHSAVRFCTSWATREEAVDRLVQAILSHQPKV